MAWGFRTCADNNVQINQISQTDLETEECDHIGAVPSRGTAIAVLFSPRAVPAAYGVNCIFGIDLQAPHRTTPWHAKSVSVIVMHLRSPPLYYYYIS